METIEGEIYKKINEKMRETTSLPIERLVVSELNTRSSWIDRRHVEHLAGRIRERGFHPKRAISVNAITDAGGNMVCHRVAAGVHRLEAAKLTGLAEIPAILYYNLTEDEECLLDRWDNEMDEDHKPVHFLEEAEHCKYLQDIKNWSQRQIAKNKGISRAMVRWRLKVASLPEDAKTIIRGGGQHAAHFAEKHFEEICKLSKPRIIAICDEIAERGELAARGEVDERGNPITPMRQSEIKARVEELLQMEKEGKFLKPGLLEPSAQGGEESRGEEPACAPHADRPAWTSGLSAGQLPNLNVKIEKKEEELEDMESACPQTCEPAATSPDEKNLLQALAHRSQEKSISGMKMDFFPRWVKSSGLIRHLGHPAYVVMKKIGEYDLYFLPKKDGSFFLSKDIYGDTLGKLAEEAGVSRDHLQKNVLPALKRGGFIDYWFARGESQFRFNWDKLFEVYCQATFTIPFKDGGMKNVPETYNGTLRPTPFHYIKIVKGQPAPWDEKEVTCPPPTRTADAVGKADTVIKKVKQEALQALIVSQGEAKDERRAPETGVGQNVFARCERYGITRRRAEEWAETFSTAYLEEKLDIIEYKMACCEEVKNPAGMLITAIEENWAMQESLIKKRETQAKKQREKTEKKVEQLKDARWEKIRDAVADWVKKAPTDLVRQLEDRARKEAEKKYPDTPKTSLSVARLIEFEMLVAREYLGLNVEI